MWRTDNGLQEEGSRVRRGTSTTCTMTADGRHVFSCSDKTVRLWSLRTGRIFRRYEGSTGELFALALSRDGRRLLAAGKDRIIRLVDVETGKEIHAFGGHTSYVWDVAFSPDDRYAASVSEDRTLRLWRLPTDPLAGKPLKRLPPPDADAQAQAEVEVKERYKAEFALRAASERAALANALRQRGRETLDAPALRFVYLREARDVAAGAGNFAHQPRGRRRTGLLLFRRGAARQDRGAPGRGQIPDGRSRLPWRPRPPS